jgi:hypothetical protein
LPEFLDIEKDSGAQTYLIYGPSGSGKTRFAATYPRPRFLSDFVERGYETVLHMDPSLFYSPDYDPRKNIVPIKTMKDFRDAISEAEVDFKKDKFSTLVIDSLTFLGDLYLDANKEVVDKRQVYGNLLTFIRGAMVQIHRIGAKICWLALDKVEADGQTAGIALAGQSANKIPAACMYTFHMGVRHDRSGKEPPTYQLHSRQDGIYPCKTRDEAVPPVIDNPSFKKLCELSKWKLPIK